MFRERAAHLVTEVQRDLSGLTVHDVTHTHCGRSRLSLTVPTDPNYAFTPTEAFVLAAAFLLHDLAMSLAARAGGIESILRDPQIFTGYRATFNRDPEESELQKPSLNCAIGLILSASLSSCRECRRASFLVLSRHRSKPSFLLEDAEIRQSLGRLVIGGRSPRLREISIGL
jgi:hypothetical protein